MEPILKRGLGSKIPYAISFNPFYRSHLVLRLHIT
jgi:hypothetical protein